MATVVGLKVEGYLVRPDTERVLNLPVRQSTPALSKGLNS
jgi:hypothetical protein